MMIGIHSCRLSAFSRVLTSQGKSRIAHSVEGRCWSTLASSMVLRCMRMLSHEEDCFILCKEGRISNIINRNREFKSALRLIEELPISIECETHSLIILHHVFDAFHSHC